MTTYFMIFLTIVTVFVVAAGLIKVGKVCSLYRGGDCGEKENLANM